jgi:hypothetical protein
VLACLKQLYLPAHTSAYVRIRQHMPAYASIFPRACVHKAALSACAYVSIRQHTSAYVSIRQHMPAYASTRQHTSAISACES